MKLNPVEGAFDPLASPSVFFDEPNPNPKGLPMEPPDFGALNAEGAENVNTLLVAGFSGVLDAVMPALKDEGRPFPIPVSGFSCSVFSSGSLAFPKRLLVKTEGVVVDVVDVGANGLGVESAALDEPKVNIEVVGAGGGSLVPNLNPGADEPSPRVGAEKVLRNSSSPGSVASGFVSTVGVKPPPVEVDVDEEGGAAEKPPKVNPEDGGTGGAFGAVFSFFKLSSYSDWTVTRRVLYRSRRLATSENGSDSTAFETAANREVFRPRKAVRYFVSTFSSSSSPTDTGSGLGFSTAGAGCGGGALKNEAKVLVAFDAVGATEGAPKVKAEVGSVAAAGLGAGGAAAGAGVLNVNADVPPDEPKPANPANFGAVVEGGGYNST